MSSQLNILVIITFSILIFGNSENIQENEIVRQPAWRGTKHDAATQEKSPGSRLLSSLNKHTSSLQDNLLEEDEKSQTNTVLTTNTLREEENKNGNNKSIENKLQENPGNVSDTNSLSSAPNTLQERKTTDENQMTIPLKILYQEDSVNEKNMSAVNTLEEKLTIINGSQESISSSSGQKKVNTENSLEEQEVNIFDSKWKDDDSMDPVAELLIFDQLIPNSGSSEDDNGNSSMKALLLSPLLKEGQIQEALNASVTRIGNLTSYTGYFTVNDSCGNHLFFWFFPSLEKNWEEAPVVLWLNGGPGASSMFGLFMEVGPWRVAGDELEENKYSWSKEHNVLFIDQPAGTGFSASEKACFARNIKTVSSEMYSALIQFFTMFPPLQNNKFFMTGESHAGHYLPAIAVEIHKRNPDASLKINLVGIMVGNPLIDVRCLHTPDFMYELGIVDSRERNEMKEPLKEFDLAIQAKNHKKTLSLYMKMIGMELIPKIGIPSIFNIIYDSEISLDFASYITKDDVRKEIHVGRTQYDLISQAVVYHMWQDRYTSQAPDIELLLNTGNYTVGFYVGQLDARCPYSSLPCVLKNLQWSGAEEYRRASRSRWYVSGRLAGWTKVAGNLYEVLVRKSGHMVPLDQAEAALALVKAMVNDYPGTQLLNGLQKIKKLNHLRMVMAAVAKRRSATRVLGRMPDEERRM